MKEFDYTIIGGGCAGLSLAYELEIHNKLKEKTLAIIEPRSEYKRDKTWSFWKVFPHNFDDCVIKNWEHFSINIPNKTNYLKCESYPYQSIDSGLFYKKINNRLKENKNISFLKDLKNVNLENTFIFNSVPHLQIDDECLWQHFCGVEIETADKSFDDSIINLMDFDCDQRESVHFFYTLPYSKNKALVETTWLSKMNNNSQKDYDNQVKNYIENHLKINTYKITYREEGAIPLFLNIQEHSKYLRENIEKITKTRIFRINKKYHFLDKLFLKVIKKHSELMPNIFFKMFYGSPKTVIKFLSNKSNILDDLLIILKMPKWIFIKALFK
jgi:lycopene beta-cyclase